MKRLATTLGILIVVAVLAAPVFAYRGGWGGWSGGPGSCWQGSEPYGNMTESQNAELSRLERKFYNDSAKIRDEIRNKNQELDVLMNGSNPDPKRIRGIQKEINDLRAKLDQQRLDFNLEARKIAPRGNFSRGSSRGYGWHRGYHGGGRMHGHGRW